MMRIPQVIAATACVVLTAVDSPAQPPSPGPAYAYADLADRALAAPVALIATVSDAIRLKPEQAPGVRTGHARLFVEATATSLIRGPAGLPPRVRYLVDVPLDARGRPPRLKGSQVLLLARPVPSRPGELQLVAPDAQLPPTAESRVRAILTEAIGADAPPQVTGIASAFHVAGTIAGEGETQIFLTTARNRPISLNVLRRPGQEKTWSVALSEVVDEAAPTPQRETLLWYRLACGLPSALPSAATGDLDAAAAAAAREDYQYVLSRLGPCGRSMPAGKS